MVPDRLLSDKTIIDARDIVDPVKESADPPAFRLAFADNDFLMSEETRGIRFQLELLKAELILKEHNIHSTIVIFGSARLRSQEECEQMLKQAQADYSTRPNDASAQAALKRAEKMLADSRYYEEARTIGQMIGAYEQAAPEERKAFVCTGGGPGIMEAANRGASESNSPNIGLNILLPHEQFPNPYITPGLCLRFHYFAARKMHFVIRAKALIAFPGGFGTLDELFEILTLVQTHKTHAVPIVLYGTDFWKKLVNFDMLVEMGMISPQDMDLFHFVDTPVEAWNAVRHWYDLPSS